MEDGAIVKPGLAESYGAVCLLDAPLSLVLPFAIAIKALKQGN